MPSVYRAQPLHQGRPAATPSGVSSDLAVTSQPLIALSVPRKPLRQTREHQGAGASFWTRRAQNDTPRLGSSQGRFGPLADLVARPIRHNRVHLDHDHVCLGHVRRNEVNTGLEQARHEVNVARQAVQLGYQQRRPRTPTQVRDFAQLKALLKWRLP